MEDIRPHLRKLTLPQLRLIARNINTKTRIVYSKLKKEELVNAINHHLSISEDGIALTKAFKVDPLDPAILKRKKAVPKPKPMSYAKIIEKMQKTIDLLSKDKADMNDNLSHTKEQLKANTGTVEENRALKQQIKKLAKDKANLTDELEQQEDQLRAIEKQHRKDLAKQAVEISDYYSKKN